MRRASPATCRLVFGAAYALAVLCLAACDDGPAEEAGEAIDDAASDAADAVDDAADKVK